MTINPEHRFDLDYLVDNGTACEPGCVLIRYGEGDYSVLDANNQPIGWGVTPAGALRSAHAVLARRGTTLTEQP
jgi:hypothetical protein